MTNYAITTTVSGAFDQLVETVIQLLAEQGLGVLTQTDVQQILQKKLQIDCPPYLILGACHPPSAYAALQAEPETGLLLPCNLVIMQLDNQVQVSAIKPTAALVSDNPQVKQIAAKIEQKLQHVIDQLPQQL